FPRGLREWDNPLLRVARPLYLATVGGLVRARWFVAPVVFVVLGGVIAWVSQRLGSEFLPYLDEGIIAMRANFPEGTSLDQTAVYADQIRAIVRAFPDIDFVSSRAGRTDSGLDPFPPSRSEYQLGPKPREHWTQFRTKRELLDALGKRLRAEFPTTRFNFTQPIV